MANEFKIKKGLIVTGASGGTVVDIQGSQGQLFSVTDDLSGSIFAVSDISGVPIFDVNSSGVSYFDGNVGIGLTNPADRLDLYDSDDNVGMYFHTATSGTGGGNGLRVGQNNANAFVWNYEATPLSLATGGTARLIINATGGIRFSTGYGAGTLVTDASGNITVSSGGGAGGPYLPLDGGTMANTNLVTNMNADLIDGYSSASLWRSDGGVWNPSSNITLGQSANSQEWSFDITRNGYTGGYWQVWDSSNTTMLKVDAVTGKVYAPYNFVGALEGSAENVGGLTASMIVSGGSGRKSTSVSTFAGVNEPTGAYYGNNVTGAPTTDWINYFNTVGNGWQSSNNYSFQLTHAFHSDNFWVSRTTNGTQSSARLVIDSGNISTQTVANATNALPLAGGVMTGNVKRSSAIVGFLEGSYNNVGSNSTNTNPIYTIGSSYNPASTSLSNMYGIGYTHAGDASFVSLTGATSWGLYVAAGGDARVFLDGVAGNMSCIGIVYASGGDSTEWNTAYDNRITSLTTTGTSGAATLISNVLNIPQYSSGTGTNYWILNSDGGTPANVTVNNVQTVDFAGGANITTSISGTGNYKNLIIDLDTGGAGAGTYGSTADGTKIDTITLDAYGRVTAVATGETGDITGITPGTGISGGGTSGTVTITNSAPNVTTNLTTSTSATTLTVNSSDGTNAVLPAATTTVAGVMTGADKTKLNGIATGATNVTNNNQITNGAGYITKTLEVCSFIPAFKTPGAQTNYFSWVNGSYEASLGPETYKTALYAGDIDVVKVISDVSVTGVTIVVSNAGGSIWSSGSFNLTANTVTSFSPSSAAFSANDQLYVTFTIPASANIIYKVDFGLLYD